MSEDREFKLVKWGVIVALIFCVTVGLILSIKCWLAFRPVRQSFSALSEPEKDRVSLDIYAAMINASQTNWTVTITPRTNNIEKP